MSHWKQVDLTVLSLRELKGLQQRIGREITRRQEEGRRWLQEHSGGLVEKRGPVYRNPHNSAETWSGRGKQPDWVAQALTEGHSLESLSKDAGVSDDFLPMKADEKAS
ncbi:MAG: H-NS histone family protein [Myxococcales bacterium]|nr:H-NS histone family protein [Myxococcales bacterium]